MDKMPLGYIVSACFCQRGWVTPWCGREDEQGGPGAEPAGPWALLSTLNPDALSSLQALKSILIHFQRVFRPISVVPSNLTRLHLKHHLTGVTSTEAKPARSIRHPGPKAETEPSQAWQKQRIMTSFI